MPSPASFRRAWNLETGTPVGSYKLSCVHLGHTLVKRYERYEFPATLDFASDGTGRGSPSRRQSLASALKAALAGEHVAHSEYGSPYNCTWDLSTLTVKDLSANVNGVAVRIRDAPEPKSASPRAQSSPRYKELRTKALSRGMRVTKSRFTTAVCPTCRQPISSGEIIVQAKSIKRGGWQHLECIDDSEEKPGSATPPRSKRRRVSAENEG